MWRSRANRLLNQLVFLALDRATRAGTALKECLVRLHMLNFVFCCQIFLKASLLIVTLFSGNTCSTLRNEGVDLVL